MKTKIDGSTLISLTTVIITVLVAHLALSTNGHSDEYSPRLEALLKKIPKAERSSVPYQLRTACPESNGRNIRSILDFGAVGDGKADEYGALRKAAETFISNTDFSKKFGKGQRGILIFPKGTYLINQYQDAARDLGMSNQDRVMDIIFQNAAHFDIIGCEAIISVKGDFEFTGDKPAGSTKFKSNKRQVTPFSMSNDHDFTISGFEIDGNADSMRPDHLGRAVLPGAGSSVGIRTAQCSDYHFSDLFIHHLSADGLYLGAGEINKNCSLNTVPDTFIRSRDVNDPSNLPNLERVISANNGRQGLTIIQVQGLTIKNSWFVFTGQMGGRLTGFAPSAGIDIEPNQGRSDGKHTQNIQISESLFYLNSGLALSSWKSHGLNPKPKPAGTTPCSSEASSEPVTFISDVHLRNSHVYSQTSPVTHGVIALRTDKSSLENSEIHGSYGDIYAGGNGTQILRNKITAIEAAGLIVKRGKTEPEHHVTVEGNTFVRLASPKNPLYPYPKGLAEMAENSTTPYIGSGVDRFVGNTVKIPTSKYTNNRKISKIVGTADLSDNDFHAPNASPKTGKPIFNFNKSRDGGGNRFSKNSQAIW